MGHLLPGAAWKAKWERYLICVVVGFGFGYALGRSCPAVVVHGCAVNGSTNMDREFRKSGTNLENRAPHAHAKHLRQILAPRTTWIIHVVRNLLRALGCKFIEPVNELGIAATLNDRRAKP